MTAKNTVDFRFDATHKVVVARPSWNVTNEQDCVTWYNQFETYFTELGLGRVDVIFMLDDFAVERTIAAVWGKYRAQMIKTFTRYSIRVNASRHASTAAHTSGALYGAASDEAPDFATALNRIREWRTKLPLSDKIRKV